jgi:hypothetical protein
MRFGYQDRRFGNAMRFGNSFTTGLSTPRQIMQICPNHISQIAPYHRYKGLSSMPNLAGNRQTTLDTKQSYIYKHHISDIGRYKGLADMKV